MARKRWPKLSLSVCLDKSDTVNLSALPMEPMYLLTGF